MRVILPGSYDPVTLGHLEIIKKASETYDEVYAVVFINESKKYRFSLEDRVRMLTLATEQLDNVLVSYSLGRVVDYMREHGIEKIVKGYRNDKDLEWEKYQAEYNMRHGGFETELIRCDDKYAEVSSTLVRERLLCADDASELLHPSVCEYIKSLKDDSSEEI